MPKDRLGIISKQGDRYLRGLFVVGALAVIRYAKIHGTKHRPLAHGVASATADQGRGHRTAQQDCADVWAMMAEGERYNEPVTLAA